MKVGTKLLAVVLPPLIVLVVVAGIGARDRLDEASDARTSEQYVELARAGWTAITELQTERSLSVLEAAAPDAAEGLEAQRQESDAALDAFGEAAAAIAEESDLAEAMNAALGRQDAIETLRQSVDRGSIDPLIVYQWYVDTVADHLEVATVVSNEVPFAEISEDLVSQVALARVAEAESKRAAVYAIALGQGEFDADGRLWREERLVLAEADRYSSLFFDIASPRQSADLRGLQQGGAWQAATAFREAIGQEVAFTIHLFGDGSAIEEPLPITPRLLERVTDAPADVTPDAAYWLQLTDAQLEGIRAFSTELIDGVAEWVSGVRSDAEQLALFYLLVTAVAIIVSGVIAIVVARKITKPLRSLTTAADRLSSEQLPALVERLKSPSSATGDVLLEPINMKRTDEIGHLADAFDAIQRVTVEVAEEQANLLKKGIGDIFVNLARRNQTLLDRQIEFIDQLESAEEDPDVLEDLFKLDHLATRMRRNAESLLVLAGIETGHRRSRPVALADVVRVAIGEVEDFARLQLVSLDDAVVSGAAAMDVAHLLSELMENATAFSPPETTVEILGHQDQDGGYVLSISDQGIGMSDEQFAETNSLLAEPPLVGLTLSRSLGFTVVGRLATRFGIQVRLTSSPTGGVTALVTLPAGILESSTISVDSDEAPRDAGSEPAAIETTSASESAFAPATTAAPESETEPGEAAEWQPVFEEPAPRTSTEEPAPDWVADAPAPSTLATAVPEGDAFDAGLAALMEEGSSSHDAESDARTTQPAAAEGPALFAAAADGESTPTRSEPTRTASGLVKRVPRASATAEAEAPGPPAAEAPITRTQRSPEEVRAMLSRYRSGLHRGRDSDSPDGSPSDGSN